MALWWKIALAAALPAALVLLILLLLYCYHHRRGGYGRSTIANQSRLFSGLHRSSRDPVESKVANVWRRTYPIKAFDWSEHPALVAEAAEHGWAAFAFAYSCSACPAAANLWDMCTARSHRREHEPEISWEMGGHSDYLQKLWLNPRMVPKKENAFSLVQALQSSLPLPGPALGAHSFPSEGYFEIIVLAEGCDYNAHASSSSFTDNEHVKLISKHFMSGKHRASELTSNYSNEMFEGHEGQQGLGPQKSGKGSEKGEHRISSIEFSRFSVQETASIKEADHLQVIAVGLAAGGAPPFRLPGLDAGSVGFQSSGRVYLNGALHDELESRILGLKHSWGVVSMTIGCGFSPTAKTVFFTVNGEHICELSTSSSEFGYPLFPTVAANYDVTLLANFGQSSFEYAPANIHRVSDPCFKIPMSRPGKNGSLNDDSGDLFSMGRIDSQWLTEIASPISDDLQHRHVLSEAESDLFEIVLDTRS